MAARNLRREGHVVYLPVFIDQYRRKRCLFPRYLFIEITAGWQMVNRTVGVSRVLLSGDEPAVIPAKFIKSLRAQENRNGNIVLVKKTVSAKAAFKIGQRLKVLRGTFQGLLVTYAGSGGSGGDVGAFKLLGRNVRSEFATGDLIPV